MTTENIATIARPYAKAAFEYALAHNDLSAWETMLQAAALVTEDKSMQRLLAGSQLSQTQLANVYGEILKPQINGKRENFLHLLAESKRLSALPAIKAVFAALRAEHEKTITVQVSSAIALDESYKQKIKQALTKRLQREVTLECSVDPDLLGGAVIRAGDLVLDGSVRGKLNRLIEFI